jgi:hypothetical protein
MDLYWEVATSTRIVGGLLGHLLANPTEALARRSLEAARRDDQAALQLAIRQGRLLHPLNVDCT